MPAKFAELTLRKKMKISFRPFPGLTIITIIMLAILIGLGTWQYHRLQWKTALLEEVELSVMAAPVTGFAELTNEISKNTPLDFRRAEIIVDTPYFETPFRVFTGENRDVSWRLYSPVMNDGVTAFAARSVIPDEMPAPQTKTQSEKLVGYVRLVRPENKSHVDSSPLKNRWFGFNPVPESHDWAQSVPGGADTRFYVDVVQGATDASLLPPKRPQIRNNHFDYMLTWYGLAIVLLVIYVILHRREGRISWS